MNRPSRIFTSAMLAGCALIIAACGGLGSSSTGTGDGVRDGLRFSSLNPTSATPGSTVEIAFDVFAATSAEANTNVTVELTANGGAIVSPASTVVRVPDSSEGQTRVVRVQIPQNAAPGSQILVRATRNTTAGGSIRAVAYPITIASTGFTASISPAVVQAPQGGNATASLTITPIGGFSGVVQVTGLDPDLVVTPATVTIPAGQTTAVTTEVTYRIPANAPVGAPILALVRAVSGAQRAIASYTVTPTTSQGQGSFTLGVTPTQVMISGGQPSSAVTVTLTPVNGFQGEVTVNVSLPGQGSLRVAEPTQNPFTVNITDGPATRTFELVYVPGQGVAPIGVATVQATADGINRTANFNVGSS